MTEAPAVIRRFWPYTGSDRGKLVLGGLATLAVSGCELATVALFGVRGERRAGRVGIWVADPVTRTEAKIGAIGVRVSRWVSWHGVALNVAPDLSHFTGIVPCGISEHGVTSLAALGISATMAEADEALRSAWGEVFGDAAEADVPACAASSGE